METDVVEKRALQVTVAANILMAIAAWITFGLTNSQAILLDGNFSFVLAIATVIALIISKIKHKRSETFPYGNYVFEAAFVLSKGLLILGIIITAFFQNAVKIMDYFRGERAETVVLVPIYYYTLFILVLTAGLLLFFNRQNKRINNQSSMLVVEAKSAKVDGMLTLATGLVFFLISFIAAGSKIDFLLYIGDSLIVIIISLAMLGLPLKIIKNAFIELGGGTLQNQQEKKEIEDVIGQVVNNTFTFDSYISKVGSGYLVVVYVVSVSKINDLQHFVSIQQQIKEKLKNNFPVISIEISVKD